MSDWPRHGDGNGSDGASLFGASKKRGRPRKEPKDRRIPLPNFFDWGDNNGCGTEKERNEWQGLAKNTSDKFKLLINISDANLKKLKRSNIIEVTPICWQNGAPVYYEIRLIDENRKRWFLCVYSRQSQYLVRKEGGQGFLRAIFDDWSVLADAGMFIPSGAPELFAAYDEAERNNTKIHIIFCEGLHARRGVQRLLALPENAEIVADFTEKHGKPIVVSWQGGEAGPKNTNFAYRPPDDERHLVMKGFNEKQIDYRLPIIDGVTIVRDADEAGRKEANEVRHELLHKYALPPDKLYMANVVDGLTKKEAEDGWDDDNPLPPGVTPQQRCAQILNAEPNAAPLSAGYVSFNDYEMSKHGLWFNDNKKTLYQIAGAFKILAMCRAKDNEAWGRLIELTDLDGKTKQIHIANVELHNGGAEAVKRLADAGLKIVPSKTTDLADYLACIEVERRVRTVDKTGWHDGAFVLPHEIIGECAGEEMFLINPGEHGHAQHGSVLDWQDGPGRLAASHRLARLAIMTQLAGPVLKLLGDEGGLLHITSFSSFGKSSLAALAASVWGKGCIAGGYIISWNTTANRLEITLASRSDIGLVIDELGQAIATEVAGNAYMMTNGAGKGRMTRDAKARKTYEWRISGFSTGEKSIEEKIAEIKGQKTPAGVQVRFVNINADAGHGLGVFDTLDGFASGKELADTMREAAMTHYGVAGPAFVRAIIEHGIDESTNKLLETRAAFERKLGSFDKEAGRVAHRFAVYAATGELAIEYGVLPWKKGSAMSAAKWGFERWLKESGAKSGSIEQHNIKRQIQSELEQFGVSRFDEAHALGERENTTTEEQNNAAAEKGDYDAINPMSDNCETSDHDRPAFTRYGHRRGKGETQQWLIFPQVWRDVFCRGYDPTKTAAMLAKQGCLKRAGKNWTTAWRVDGKLVWGYCVTSAILNPELSD